MNNKVYNINMELINKILKENPMYWEDDAINVLNFYNEINDSKILLDKTTLFLVFLLDEMPSSFLVKFNNDLLKKKILSNFLNGTEIQDNIMEEENINEEKKCEIVFPQTTPENNFLDNPIDFNKPGRYTVIHLMANNEKVSETIIIDEKLNIERVYEKLDPINSVENIQVNNYDFQEFLKEIEIIDDND